ncbi:MAG: biotin transporter BioY [Peptococcaceae bacterium]|nr:biotin transporter BioY [Peptococcaceae bacterium]
MKLSVREMVLVSMFAALTAVGAFIKVPIPYVPFTLQFLFVLFAGMLLGKKLGLLSQVVYLLVGLAGAPVFASGGGPGYVLQPTFGYLVGFAAGAYVVGLVLEKIRGEGFPRFLLAALAGLAVVYAFGVTYLYFVLNFVVHKAFTFAQALWIGAVVCLPGDLFLSVLAAAVSLRVLRRYAAAGGVLGRG